MRKLFLLSFLCFLAPKVHATNIWASGFELGDLVTAEMEINTVTGVGSSTNSATVRSGTYSYKSSATAATANLLHKPLADSETTAYLTAWIYIETAPGGLTAILNYEDSTAFVGGGIRMNSNRTLECWEDTAQVGSDSSAVPLATWTQIGFKYDDIVDAVDCELSGVSFAAGAATDLAGGGQIRFGWNASATGVIYWDDVIWNNAAGATPNNSFAGDEKLIHLNPNGAGDLTTDTGIGGTSPAATVWESVDEVKSDEGVTVATITATTSLFDIAMEAASVGGIGTEDTITFVAVGVRAAAMTAAACTYIPRIFSQSMGIISSGTTTTYNTTPYSTNDDTDASRNYKLISQTDPQQGTAWTPSDVDGMQIRIATSDATPDVFITKVWGLVAFIDNAAVATRRILSIQ